MKWNWNHGELKSADKNEMELETQGTDKCQQISNGTRITGN